MSKVLIDRAVLEATLEHAEFVSGAACDADDAIRAVLDTPSGTPVMPVKAYYHESTRETGAIHRSVGLEQRKIFRDAPLVLESDALAGFSARDARLAELEAQYQRDVYGLNNEGDPIGGDPAGGYANDNALLRAELAAIKAQEPVAWLDTDGELYAANVLAGLGIKTHKLTPLYAAPVSEAKAQGVVQWPDADEIMQMAFEEGQPADDASGYCFELEEFDLFIERLMSEVARLNAAPVQQVGVPDGSTKMQWPEIVALVNEVLGCEAHKYPCERGSIGHEMTGINFNSLARIIDRVRHLSAAPAAPAEFQTIPKSLENARCASFYKAMIAAPAADAVNERLENVLAGGSAAPALGGE